MHDDECERNTMQQTCVTKSGKNLSAGSPFFPLISSHVYLCLIVALLITLKLVDVFSPPSSSTPFPPPPSSFLPFSSPFFSSRVVETIFASHSTRNSPRKKNFVRTKKNHLSRARCCCYCHILTDINSFLPSLCPMDFLSFWFAP